jgi:hypothetical protein
MFGTEKKADNNVSLSKWKYLKQTTLSNVQGACGL